MIVKYYYIRPALTSDQEGEVAQTVYPYAKEPPPVCDGCGKPTDPEEENLCSTCRVKATLRATVK